MDPLASCLWNTSRKPWILTKISSNFEILCWFWWNHICWQVRPIIKRFAKIAWLNTVGNLRFGAWEYAQTAGVKTDHAWIYKGFLEVSWESLRPGNARGLGLQKKCHSFPPVRIYRFYRNLTQEHDFFNPGIEFGVAYNNLQKTYRRWYVPPNSTSTTALWYRWPSNIFRFPT